MYTDAMERTQIYLGREEIEALDREAGRTGASRSELIRRAVRAQYHVSRPSPDERKDALRRSAGIWADRDFTGAEYVEAMRSNARDRLARLGLLTEE